MMRILQALPSLVVRHRRALFLAWALAAAVVLPLARRIERRLEAGTRVPGSESARVAELLTTHFATPFARYAVLVVRGVPAPITDSGRRVLRRVVDGVRSHNAVAGTLSILDVPDTLFLGRGGGGGTFVLTGLRDVGTGIDSILPSLRAGTESFQRSLRATYPRAELMWTGELPLTVDLRRVSADDANRAERRVLPLTLGLLVVAFGAFAAALTPVVIGALAIAMTLGCVALVTHVLPVSILVLNVVTMLGLGLGIDYALLLVSRFREGLAAGLDSDSAAIEAAAHAGASIALSGAAVLVGFLALLLVPLTDLRSIAIGGALVTTVSVLLATTLLPGVLSASGRRIEMGRVGRARGSSSADFWRRWSTQVVGRPLIVLLVAAAPTVALAWQWRGLETHTPSGDWLPPSIESARGLHALQTMGRGGIVQNLRVVVEFSEATPASSLAGRAALGSLMTQVRSNPRVARLTPSAVSPDKRFVLLDVLPTDSGGVTSAMALVRDIRLMDAASPFVSGLRLSVGGLPAFNVDYGDGIRQATPRVVALVVGGTFLALLIGFRSVLVPLKAIALNLLSVAAAFGAVVLVFQKGFASGMIGLAAPLDGIFPAVPLLVFCTVFGLSMDYEVFLVSRVAEARRAGKSESEAVVEGVARTGGVITSAAVVMIVVFGAFMMGEFVFMKILGFALAVAVLLDVTVIRLALGPALLRLAGRWNWWPGVRATGRSIQDPPSVRARSGPRETPRRLSSSPS